MRCIKFEKKRGQVAVIIKFVGKEPFANRDSDSDIQQYFK